MDRASRRLLAVAVIASVALIYVYPLTLGTPLLDPDEGLHASIAQEMVERGDYVIPRFCGEPFRDKPIAYFLAQAVSLRLFGMNEAAVRLPGVLLSLLGCLTTGLLAWRLFDKEVALYALVASLTMVLPVMLTQSPAHDIALVPAINLLALCFWEQERTESVRLRWSWLAGGIACIAVALLTKGLIGIAVFAVGIALYAAVTGSVSWRLAMRCVFVLGVGSAIAAPWFLAMETASPGYLNYYFIQRHLYGYVTEAQTHGQAPWHYYAAPVLGGALPWLLYAIASVAHTVTDKERTEERRACALLACWFVGGFLFLSVANSKLITYSLPLFPPVAVLAGAGFAQFFRGRMSKGVGLGVATSFRTACLLGILGPVITLLVFDRRIEAESPLVAYAIGIAASVVIAVAWLLFERGERRLAFACGVLWFPLLFLALMHGPLQECAERHSQRDLAREISKLRPVPHELVMIGEQAGSVLFYLTPQNRDWFREARVTQADGRALDQLAELDSDWVVAITDKELGRTTYADEVRRKWPTVVGTFRLIDCSGHSVSDSRGASSANRK